VTAALHGAHAGPKSLNWKRGMHAPDAAYKANAYRGNRDGARITLKFRHGGASV